MIRITKLSGIINIVLKSFVKQFEKNRNATVPKKCYQFGKIQNSIIPLSAVIGFQFPLKNKCATNSAGTENVNLNDLVRGATDALINKDFQTAKIYLYKALDEAEKDKKYDLVSIIFDNLAAIAMQEGTILEVEDLLVQFIEKLISIGYPEDGNSIIRFKLKLSRIYYMMRKTEMAELGFRHCVNIQEQKILKKDEEITTNQLYISTLFWYGRFLTEEEEYDRAHIYMNKCLKHAKQIGDNLTTAQIMVILFHNAEVAFKLKKYDDSIDYLVEAINLCVDTNPINEDLPIFIVKLGIVFLHRGLYEKARFWCESGQQLSEFFNNRMTEKESQLCLQKINELEQKRTTGK